MFMLGKLSLIATINENPTLSSKPMECEEYATVVYSFPMAEIPRKSDFSYYVLKMLLTGQRRNYFDIPVCIYGNDVRTNVRFRM